MRCPGWAGEPSASPPPRRRFDSWARSRRVGTPVWTGSSGGGLELTREPHLVEPTPALDDLVPADAEDLDALQDEGRPGGRHAHQGCAVGAAGDEPLDDDVPFG